MTKRTLQILLGNKSSLRAANSQNIHLLAKQLQTCGCTSNTDRSAFNNPIKVQWYKVFSSILYMKIPNSEVLELRMGWNGQMERSISIRPVQPKKEVHLERRNAFSKLFRLDRTDPFSFRPKFLEILVRSQFSNQAFDQEIEYRKQVDYSMFCQCKNTFIFTRKLFEDTCSSIISSTNLPSHYWTVKK